MAINEYSGLDQTEPLDNFAISNGSSAAPEVSITPNTTPVMCAGLMNIRSSTGGITPDADYTENQELQNQAICNISVLDRNISAADTITWGTANNVWACIAATFKEAAAGGGTLRRYTLPLLGVG
jgi:hypothetical protein